MGRLIPKSEKVRLMSKKHVLCPEGSRACSLQKTTTATRHKNMFQILEESREMAAAVAKYRITHFSDRLVNCVLREAHVSWPRNTMSKEELKCSQHFPSQGAHT